MKRTKIDWCDCTLNQEIVKVADDSKCKVFMKGSLKELMGNEFRQDEDLWKREGE